MTALSAIEGIGDALVKAFDAEGVDSVEDLLRQGATPKGRKALAKVTGIAEARILKFVNHADLFRIKGVAGELAELLEAAGVDSVPELAQRNAENLAAALGETNEANKLVRRVPSKTVVTAWVKQAKDLPRAVHH